MVQHLLYNFSVMIKWLKNSALQQVVDATKTCSVLDFAGFNEILRLHKEGKTRELKEWIGRCVQRHPDNHCASVILDSFVEKGIIGKEDKWFGLKRVYPTKDKGILAFLICETAICPFEFFVLYQF